MKTRAQLVPAVADWDFLPVGVVGCACQEGQGKIGSEKSMNKGTEPELAGGVECFPAWKKGERTNIPALSVWE